MIHPDKNGNSKMILKKEEPFNVNNKILKDESSNIDEFLDLLF